MSVLVLTACLKVGVFILVSSGTVEHILIVYTTTVLML